MKTDEFNREAAREFVFETRSRMTLELLPVVAWMTADESPLRGVAGWRHQRKYVTLSTATVR